MYLDFHTHGKLAKKLPFSEEYTHWLFGEARAAGLDALCLTEHFNTWGFAELYRYITSHADREGDTLVFDGLRIFPGMETDIAEGGHILSVGPMEAILELNRRLEPNKAKGNFLPFARLMDLFGEYPVFVGGAHPFRAGGHIPELPTDQLMRLDFLEMNGKDLAEDRTRTELLTRGFGKALGVPATLAALRRTRAGAFAIEQAHTLPEILQAAAEGRAEDWVLDVDALTGGFNLQVAWSTAYAAACALQF